MCISEAAIYNLRDNEVFEKAASLMYCLNNSDVNIAMAAAQKLGTLPPTVVAGFSEQLSRSVLGVALLHRAQQLVPSGEGRSARATRRQDEGAVIETNSEDNNQDSNSMQKKLRVFGREGIGGTDGFCRGFSPFKQAGGRVGLGKGGWGSERARGRHCHTMCFGSAMPTPCHRVISQQ